MNAGKHYGDMPTWLAQPRDYASLEVNRLLIAATCAPFEEPPPRLQMPCSEACRAGYGR